MTSTVASPILRFALFVALGWAATRTLTGRVLAEQPARGKEIAPRLVRRIESGYIRFYALSPDGKLLAYAEEISLQENKGSRQLVLVDLTTGKELHRRKVGHAPSGLFSPDGKLLAVGSSSKEASVWDVEKWEQKLPLKVPDEYQTGRPLAFSSDGKYVAGCTHHVRISPDFKYRLIVWDLSTGRGRILGKEGQLQEIPTSMGFFIDPGSSESGAIMFSDNGAPLLFAQYRGFGRQGDGPMEVIAAWDLGQGKLLTSTLFSGSLRWDYTMQGGDLRGRGDPVPGSAADEFRFRLAAGGRLLGFPKYNRPPITVIPHERDGTIAVTVTPAPTLSQTRPPVTELCRLDEFKNSENRSCRLSADGGRLVAAGVAPRKSEKDARKGLICIWDVSGLHDAARRKTPRLERQEPELLWELLFKEVPHFEGVLSLYNVHVHNAFRFHQEWESPQAMVSLAASPKEAVAWLRKRMGPPLERARVQQLLEQVESRKHPEREEATRVLHQWGPMIRPELEAALKKDPPTDKKKRLQAILDHVKATTVSRELRTLRIIDVLEHIRTAEARELLRLIAEGRYGEAVADEAKKALKRSTSRP